MPDPKTLQRIEEGEERPLKILKEAVKKYVKDPSLVNKETMQNLLKALEMIDKDVEGEDEESEHNTDHKTSHKGKPTLAIIIGEKK